MHGDEARHAERDLEQRPAIHTVHVDRRCLDGVVQFERVVHVGRAAQREGELVDPFPDRQFGPSRAIPRLINCWNFCGPMNVFSSGSPADWPAQGEIMSRAISKQARRIGVILAQVRTGAMHPLDPAERFLIKNYS